ncbi:MAG: glycosyltransferase [Planctomycetes bacterium]|nr:glycosyltransferase [Planctomycetota bacterium]
MAQKKIRILYVLDTLFIGGAEQHVATLCRHLDKEKFHIVVCTLFSRDPNLHEPIADEIRVLGIRVEQLAMQRWRDWRSIAQFLRLIDDEQIDIVHGHMVPADFWGSFMAKIFRRRKTIYTCHQPFLKEGYAMRVQQFALNIFLADRIVSVSEATTHFCSKICHASPKKIIKIPNAVDTDRFTPEVSGSSIRAELGLSDDVFIIGNIGRYTPEKGYPFFIETAAKVAQTHQNARFLIVGHGSEYNKLTDLIEKLGLTNRFFVTGPRRDIPEILGAVDIFLFTSIWGEAFGISLIEAMAAGKPIIAANIGPTKEIIEDGITGLLPYPEEWEQETDYLDADALARSVDYLIRNPHVRNQLGQEARSQAVKRFSITTLVKSIESLYISMIEKSR